MPGLRLWLLRGWYLGCLLLPTHGPAQPLAAFVAEYRVEHRGLPVGKLTQILAYPEHGRYRFSSRLEATGLAGLVRRQVTEEISEGTYTPGGFEPAHYRRTRISGAKRRETAVEFQRAEGLIIQTHAGLSSTLPLESEVSDRLAYQLMLRLDLAKGREVLRYHLADDGKLKEQRLQREGEGRLSIGGLELDTTIVTHGQTGSGRRTSLWCAPGREYLPLRIEYQEKDGTRTRATLRE